MKKLGCMILVRGARVDDDPVMETIAEQALDARMRGDVARWHELVAAAGRIENIREIAAAAARLN